MLRTLLPVLVTSLLIFSGPAYGADRPAIEGPAIEVGGGFSALASGGCCLPTMGTVPFGWYGDLDVHLRNWFSITGEVGGDYETVQPISPVASIALPSAHRRTYAFLAGPRLAFHPTHNLRIFGEVLLGGTRREAAFIDPAIPPDIYAGANYFSWQPGAGIDLGVSQHVILRVEGAYRLTPMAGLAGGHAQQGQPRFSTGIVFRP
jgi:hypothetical protein